MKLEPNEKTFINKDKVLWVFFTLAILMFYPLVYPKLFGQIYGYYSYLSVVTVPLLSMFCVLGTLIFTNIDALKQDFKNYRLIYLLFGLIFAICFIGIFFRGFGLFRIQISNYFSSIALITIPLFIRIACNKFCLKKWLAFLVLFIYFANLIIAAIGVAKGRFAYGLPGNTNWQASIAIVLLPIIFWIIYEYTPKNIKSFGGEYVIMAIFTALSVWLEYVSGSKGAMLAIVAGIGFYIVGKIGNRFFRCLTIWSALVAAFSLIIFTVIALKMEVRLIDNDIRSHLWAGAVKLFSSDFNFIFGIPNNAGSGSFESAFSSFNSVQYYLAKIASGRNNHPHNQLLYLFVCYGAIGAIALWGLLFAILWPLYVRFTKLNFYIQMLLISSLMLLTHGMVDLVLHEWPTNILFLIFIGILSNEIFKFDYKKLDSKKQSFAYNFILLSMLAILGYQFVNNFEASVLDRSGRVARDLKKYKEANDFYKKSIEKFPKPRVFYDAMSNAFYDLADLKLVKYYGEKITESGVDSFSHNKLLMSVVAINYNDYDAALFYLDEERLNYPADVMPVILKYYICSVLLKNEQLSERALKDMRKVFSYRIKDEKELNKVVNHFSNFVKSKEFSAYKFVNYHFRKFK